jgi:predicted Rossmann fold flavoprotein
LLKGNNIEFVNFDVIVIGGGAAGFYAAIQAGEMNPGLKILIVEKSGKLLSKVRVSGGGRCNVTHHCYDAVKLSQHYPRGEKRLRAVFKEYGAKHTVAWFASKGVELKVEDDGRMFPVTDSSETIVQCLRGEAERQGIRVECGFEVTSIRQADGGGFQIASLSGQSYTCARLVITTGGSPKAEAYSFIRDLGHALRPPIPSLFTFNDPQKTFTHLMGVSVPNAEMRIATTKFKQCGPLLITHWGLSGPAVIKLSAWAAEHLYAVHYDFAVLVSWIGPVDEAPIRELLLAQKIERSKQRVAGNPLFDLPLRLWSKLCLLSGIPEEKIWAEMPHRNINKLLEYLIRCPFSIRGKTTFKEEFVTCGGVDLAEVYMQTMESRKIKGVFFAGEVLDIDGETGGFNFQAAWSTAFLAARAIAACSPKLG